MLAGSAPFAPTSPIKTIAIDEPTVSTIFRVNTSPLAGRDIETMRREGFEMQVSRPEIVTKPVDGVRMEPVEDLVIDVAEEFQGVIIAQCGQRRGTMTKMVKIVSAFINDDELVKVTPHNLRMRKRVPAANMRPRRQD